MLKNRKKALAIVGGLAAVAIVAIAVAYWTGAGSGSGTANVAEGGEVTLTATVTEESAPGTTVPVELAASNATNSPVKVNTVELEEVTVDGAHETCDTADFTMADVLEEEEVGAEEADVELPNNGALVYANTGANQDACKGATLTLHLTSN
jgi:hypothetical protein